MSQIPGFTDGIASSDADATSWTEIKNLSIDVALWHFIVWRTTVPLCCDFKMTGDTKFIKGSKVPAGNMWEQINNFLFGAIFAKATCNRYGMIFAEVDTQYRISRAGIPSVMSVTKSDRSADFVMDIQETPKTARVDSSGVLVLPGNPTQALFSLSNGHMFKHYGSIKTVSVVAMQWTYGNA